MTKAEALRKVASHRDELHRMGVKSLALFGSVARGESAGGSDVDFLVEFDRPVGYFHFLDVQERLERILGARRVDLVHREAVLDELKDIIYAEAVNAL